MRRSALLAMSAAVAGFGCAAGQSFGDVYGNNGGTALNVAGSWTNESNPVTDIAPPGAADIARWDSLSVGGNTVFNLGQPTSWLGISIANPSAAVTIGSASDNSSGGALTLGIAGIDMSAATQNLTMADALSLSGNQIWNVAAGRTLTVATPVNLSGSALTITGSGNVSANNAAYVFSGTGGSLIKDGSGTFTLGALNTYTGATVVNNGTLSLQMNTVAANDSSGSYNGGNLPIVPNIGPLVGGGGTIVSVGGADTSGAASPAFIETFAAIECFSRGNHILSNPPGPVRESSILSIRSIGLSAGR